MENNAHTPGLEYGLALMTDVPRIWEIIGQAKAQMKRAGSQQWQDGYPTLEIIAADIAAAHGFVLRKEGEVVAYGAVSFDSEPAYGALEGAWLKDQSYVVIHRLAVADGMKHQGVATRFFRHAAQYAARRGVHSFRVDTNFDNTYMLRLLKTVGFTGCGKVSYGPRGERLAFEKLI
jgi:GNAT superfamily N-acetyltransferase